jgi:DNA repair exonuclease SbcCD ATPase subunit
MRDYEIAARQGVAALASEFAPEHPETDDSWSVEKAEKAFFKRLEKEAEGHQTTPASQDQNTSRNRGQRFTYRPSQIHWREVWMPFAAAVLLALALGIAAYRTGIRRGTEVAQSTPDRSKESGPSLEEQVSDAGHERVQLAAKLAEQDRVTADLRRQLAEQQKEVNELRVAASAGRPALSAQQPRNNSNDLAARRGEELAAAQARLRQLQATIDTMTRQREDLTSRASTLEAKVGELTQLVRDRERDLDQKQEQVARQQDLLEHDRDIRELMGARDLYVAEVHDVSGTGQTNGRVFFTKGKRLV